jgi:dihydrofolate synthase/folylpolyglutamate synthase
MSYAAAQRYLLGTIDEIASGRRQQLGRMRALLRELGDPQDRYPTLHVGGTSGKGSTSTMLAAALSGSGKRTGLHTKPHLSSMTERMRIDGVAISENDFALLLDEIRPAIDAVTPDYGRATYYETLLVLSFVYFARAEVDVAVVEVGLGGTQDGTNVLQPQVCVITNIGLDHTEVLGSTLEEIARDKAGIAKPGVPLVSDVADASARAVIENGCAAAGAPFLPVRDLVRIDARGGGRYGQAFVVTTPADRYELSLPVLGAFQQRNAATAILALEQLQARLRPTREQIELAMSRLAIPGRMEFFPSRPPVVFDIAHNPDKARSLVDALLQTFPAKRYTAIVAISESKNAKGVLEQLARLPAKFTFTSFDATGRTAIEPARLASILEDFDVSARAVADPLEAFSIARSDAPAEDIVLVTGSTYVVGTLRDWWFVNTDANTH